MRILRGARAAGGVAITLALVGCGYSTSSERAVKSATIEELMVAQSMQRQHVQSDFSERLSKFRSAYKDRYDVPLSNLADSKEVSDLRISTASAPIPKGPSIAGQAVLYEFRLGKQYDVKLQFITEVRTYSMLSLAHWPALMDMSVSREGQSLYQSGSAEKQLVYDMLRRIIVEQDAIAMMDGAWTLVQEEKAKAKAKEARQAEERIAAQQAEQARHQADEVRQQEADRMAAERRAQDEQVHFAALEAARAEKSAPPSTTTRAAQPNAPGNAQAPQVVQPEDAEAKRVHAMAQEKAKAWMDDHWKPDTRVNEASNKFNYDMNYRRKVNDFARQLHKQNGG